MSRTIKISLKNKTKAIIFLVVCSLCFFSLFFSTTLFLIKKTFAIEKKQEYTKTFDASLLNKYYSGKFTLKFTEKNDCQLVETKNFKMNPLQIGDKQYPIKLFNLGNGQFRDKSDFYTIQTIGENAFKDNKNIGDTLAIPTTISKINKNAFAHTTIKNVCIKNATNFLPINENVFAGCRIKKIFTRNEKYNKDPNWIKICKNIKFKPYEQNDYKKFLSDITFDINGYYISQQTGLAWLSGGTAWFVDKVNHNANNDYKYWIATNMHVCNSVTKNIVQSITNNIKKEGNLLFNFFTKDGLYNLEEISKNFSSWSDIVRGNKKIIEFDINSVEKEEDFTSDFCIIKIEFFVDNIPEIYKKKVKSWLDSLNRRLLLNNLFVTYATNVLMKDAKVYSLGYPTYPANLKFSIDGVEIHWENQSKCVFQNAKICYSRENYVGDYPDAKGVYHKQIYGMRNIEHSAFGPGSSGSMIIDENFNVVGIHFGSKVENNINNYGCTNLSECLYVNDEYNPIAKFLRN